MKFMNGLAGFVQALEDPPKLKILVETLGFGDSAPNDSHSMCWAYLIQSSTCFPF